MAHHIPPFEDEPSIELLELREKLGVPEGLGATGDFPDGKLCPEDEGEIRFAVAADKDAGLVHLDFGKPVTFMSMTVKQAADLGQLLNDKAREAE